ncbi:MAG TPA: nucleotide exchange factor GrpE [Burkholderiales bacterium]|nr:nucleotide exchange factor GrpE [Burkholderiales bacterium]
MQDSQQNHTPELIQEKPEAAEQSVEQAASEPLQGTTPSLEEMLRKAELAAQEHHDAWLRARAEADNIRKRAQVDIANAHKYAVENFSIAILAVKDSLEAALSSENATLESLKSGVDLTLKLLTSIFEKFNICEINALGEKFDPHRHQAITTVESVGEPNTVISVMQKGYTLNDRVIRPALVVVGKPKKT